MPSVQIRGDNRDKVRCGRALNPQACGFLKKASGAFRMEKGFKKYAPFIVFLLISFIAFPAEGSSPEMTVEFIGGTYIQPVPEVSSDLSFAGGYRTDNLNWNIAGDINGANPNILSELKWEDLRMFTVKAVSRTFIDLMYLRGSFDYGWINSGANQDSDFNGNDRTLEFSRSVNRSDGGTVWDASLGVGFKIGVPHGDSPFRLMPMLGYSYHRQNLEITDGLQVIPPTGPFAGLHSTYGASWTGPWFGFDMVYKFKKAAFRGTVERHMISYSADADWNLRSAFQHPVSFQHTADGDGTVLSAGIDYTVDDQWSVNGGLDVQHWRAKNGIDRTFFADGTISDTKLNEVTWDSTALLLGLTYRF